MLKRSLGRLYSVTAKQQVVSENAAPQKQNLSELITRQIGWSFIPTRAISQQQDSARKDTRHSSPSLQIRSVQRVDIYISKLTIASSSPRTI